MLGKNPVRPQELGDGLSLWVQEVFYTLQGEGPLTGQPAVFVRLAGCNLRCFFCDTDFESSQWHPSLADLLNKIESERGRHCSLIVITGGEPFRQNIRPLVDALLQDGLTVQIETNGTLWLDLPENDNIVIVCSPKTAFLHPEIEHRAHAFKYVVAAGETSDVDGLPAKSTQAGGVECHIRRPRRDARVFVMPMDSGDVQKNTANTITAIQSAKNFGYSLTLQTHKLANFK
jgi:7-carboxy-7-deazaguanine synthase